MAFLNLKDRVIEAKVAYFGHPTRNCSAAVDVVSRKMGGTTVGGDSRLVAASLPPSRRVNGCDVHVRVCAGKEDDDTTALETLREADAVVLVVEDMESGISSSRAALDRLERELEHVAKRPPIVVQVQETNVADRLRPEAVLEALGIRELPHFVARASDDTGLVETLDAAVERIVVSMRERPGRKGPADNRAAAPGLRKPPLEPLAPVDEPKEASVVGKAPSEKPASSPAHESNESRPEIRSEETPTLLAIGEAVRHLEQAVVRLEARVSERDSDLARRLDELEKPHHSALEARVEALLAKLAEPADRTLEDRVMQLLHKLAEPVDRGLENRVTKLLDKLAKPPEREIADSVDALGMELRARDVELIERLTAAKDRDTVMVESLTAIRAATSQLNTDIRRVDPTRTIDRAVDRAIEKITSELEPLKKSVTETSAAIASLSVEIATVSAFLRKLAPELARVVESVLGGGLAKLDTRILHESEATTTKLTELQELSQATSTAINGAIEEAKQKKRGWFG